jgi:5-methylcytosine-specific restriction endonuclease McrA
MHDKVRPVTQDLAEYKFYGPHALEEKFERLKGALAHSHPNMDLGELIDKLADLGLEKFVAQQKRTSRQRPNSQAEVSRTVEERDQDICTNCGSIYAIQKDHIIPRAAGGRSTITNQRQLCRSCNQRAAIEYFGLEKMDRHVNAPPESPPH